MPKRTDIKKILIIGSGPIVIGQACEFDYSGTQACKALREEGYEIVLVNSNPATIMTDPETADVTYIEPITVEAIEKVIAKERPDALLPTLGGQTALNVTVKLVDAGILEKYNVQTIGANYDAIHKAEDRDEFKKAMTRIGLDLPHSGLAYSMEEARTLAGELGFPLIIRASFTLGGTGGNIAYNQEEFERMAQIGLDSSMINEILIEESILGWKEFELEVMRDLKDNVVIICSIENLDPMGIHTGDSITVAPAQTLTDVEYQKMRDAALAVMREIGVDTGGSNVQFAINPEDGRMVIIEMNPRVSRSSALASKATGFPIAKIAAKLAVGYTLDEIQNDITRETPASFEPSIDYCVIKIPRFTFEKFPEAKDVLGISMKSVGETMAIGRTFKEALQKGLRGLEIGHVGLDNKLDFSQVPDEKIKKRLQEPNASRVFYIKYALQKGYSQEDIIELTKIDPWFIDNFAQIVELENQIVHVGSIKKIDSTLLLQAKQFGFSDKQLGELLDTDEMTVRMMRKKKGIEPVFKLVDTCAAEFEAYTPYYYSTYEVENESRISDKKKIMILGGGPNRIGQGIEFDYCCCHASFALKEQGYETIMVNSNPETVSTDYDTSDKLYFEPLTFEDVMNIIDREKPDGIIVQFGGQTPLNLARKLHEAGAPIVGTSVESIDDAENRDKFSEILKKLDLKQTDNDSVYSADAAFKAAEEIGYPVVVRPSYVLGGRAMRIVYSKEQLQEFIEEAVQVSEDQPILVDKFLEDATEVDVDAVSDGSVTVIGGIMEHIEEAGIHSGDSACVIPPYSLKKKMLSQIKDATFALSKELKVKGLMNIQYAIKDDDLYVLEVNPRASRTVPFVSKATGIPLAKVASRCMVGQSLHDIGFTKEVKVDHISVKESVLPFSRFAGVDIVLGPEMKSTGEVMGIDTSFGMAFAKSQASAGVALPTAGKVFVSVRQADKKRIVAIVKKLKEMGFSIVSTKGTWNALKDAKLDVDFIHKVSGGRPNIADLIKNNEIQLIINTPSGIKPKSDMKEIRNLAVMHNIPCITTIAGAQAAVSGIESLLTGQFSVTSVQEYIKNTLGVAT